MSRKKCIERMACLYDEMVRAEESGDIAKLQSAILETLVLTQALASLTISSQ